MILSRRKRRKNRYHKKSLLLTIFVYGLFAYLLYNGFVISFRVVCGKMDGVVFGNAQTEKKQKNEIQTAAGDALEMEIRNEPVNELLEMETESEWKEQEQESEMTVSGNTSSKQESDSMTDYPESLTYEYLMNHYYTVVSGTTLTKEDMPVQEMLSMDMKIKQDNTLPQILIYHTHGMEDFVDSTKGDRSTGIIGVGQYLAELLKNQYGYNVIHITESFDYVNGKLDRSKAYDYAYDAISQILADNPSIEVVIDLHRDGVGEQTRLVTDINGKPTAKIMLFNGMSRSKGIGEIGYLYNPYRKENLALTLQLKLLAEKYYPGFTRKNYIQAYQYNLHVRPKAMLIEAGAQTNTFEEVKNAMDPLADLLHREFS